MFIFLVVIAVVGVVLVVGVDEIAGVAVAAFQLTFCISVSCVSFNRNKKNRKAKE